MSREIAFSVLPAAGARLHVAHSGPDDGAPVLLLHGFPEPWFAWRRQIPALAAAGFRVLAPDQRGYNRSDKPAAVADYNLDTLAADVLALLDALELPRATLVGHDWGGIVAWWVALNAPHRVERLAILNAPHPVAFRRDLWTDPAQLARSWYTLAFQLPGLPEWAFRRRRWHALAHALVRTSRHGTFSAGDIEEYRQAWSQPGAIRSMIHWYRAALRRPPRKLPDPRVHVPTRILWGAQDHFLRAHLADASHALCDDAELVRLDTATHWLHHEEPARVNHLLLDFLAPALTPH